jgi:hypothetical protein
MAYFAPGTVSAGADFLRRYRPCVVNYAVQFRLSLSTGEYFVTPYPGYSTKHGTDPPYGMSPAEQQQWPGGVWYIGTETECVEKLHRDLTLLACNGFNTLRIVGIGPSFVDDDIIFPIEAANPATISSYLDLLTWLLDELGTHDLKAILLIGANTNGNFAQWQHAELFRSFLRELGTRVADHPSVLALDLYNEPGWLYPNTSDINKLATAHWIADSYWTLKSVAPNQLVTIGLTHPGSEVEWDPALAQVDFVSYHFYGRRDASSPASEKVAALSYWAKQTAVRPWIIGETAVGGTDNPAMTAAVGSELDQLDYAVASMKRSLDCGGDGYSWWQYQEVKWGDDYGDTMGLLTRLDAIDPSNSERKKPVFSAFRLYPGAIRNPANAAKPSIYPNLDSHPQVVLQGTVIDSAGKPLGDASVRAKVGTSSEVLLTLSEPDGTFELSAPAGTTGAIGWAHVSKPGYAVADPTNGPQSVLEVCRDQAWSQRWVASTKGKIEIHDMNGIIHWNIATTDKLYVGDFDGDGGEELLLCATGGATNKMMVIKFDGQWRLLWTNGGNANAGNGIYPYRGRIVVGDFDGDGADELLGTDSQGNWLTMFKYLNSDWQWIWSSYPTSPSHALKPYAGKLKSGRFGGEEDMLLGSAGWNTLFRFSLSNNDWEWVDSDYGMTNDASHPMSFIRPYASSLMIADFDGDGRDELLGFGGTAATAWVTLFGVRSTNAFEWLASSSGSREASMAGLVPYQTRAICGRFDQPRRGRVLGMKSRMAMYGYAAGDFDRLWSFTDTTVAGKAVTPGHRLLKIRPVRGMPDYLLVVAGKKENSFMVAFDPITG